MDANGNDFWESIINNCRKRYNGVLIANTVSGRLTLVSWRSLFVVAEQFWGAPSLSLLNSSHVRSVNSAKKHSHCQEQNTASKICSAFLFLYFVCSSPLPWPWFSYFYFPFLHSRTRNLLGVLIRSNKNINLLHLEPQIKLRTTIQVNFM